MKILVAEDDRATRLLLERSITKLGHEVALASDGDEAWQIVKSDETLDLAILDWMMPGLEGPEICRMSRSLSRPIPIHTILLTSRDRRDDILKGFESGVDDYITKPLDQEILEHRLRIGGRMLELHKDIALGGTRRAGSRTNEGVISDWTTLMERFGNDTRLLKQSLSVFLGRLPRYLYDITDAVVSRDSEKIFEIVHTFKGVLAFFASESIVGVTIRLEMKGRLGDLIDVEQAFADFEENMVRFRPEAAALLASIE